MKNYLKLLVLFTPFLVLAQNPDDVKSIKSMCGCFDVKFNFKETFSYPKDSIRYKVSPEKHESGLEWAEIIQDEKGKISIQHLLIVGKNTVIKHWRQDWIFENNTFYDYNGSNDWNYKQLTKDKVKNQWTQKVFEVDDKPRYEGSATWIHVDGRHFWENKTNAPLPRREYTQREDYNITKRLNDVEIFDNYWVHNQDNDKVIKNQNNEEYILAQEKGYNIYTKVDDSLCMVAQKWWNENKSFWEKVRIKWEEEYKKNKNLKLINLYENKPLYVHLSNLKNNASQDEINKVIELFIIK